MKKTKAAWLLATWFGCGYSPFAPGTAGSLASIAIAVLLCGWDSETSGFRCYLFCFSIRQSLPPELWPSNPGRKDPQVVVVDEVVGQWLTLAGARHLNWMTFATAFALFRLFDIWKPPPIRRIERIPGGAGIVLDDMMAGVYGHLSYLRQDGSISTAMALRKNLPNGKPHISEVQPGSCNYGRRTVYSGVSGSWRRLGL